MKYRSTIYFLGLLFFFSGCIDDTVNHNVTLSAIYVSYYPSRGNYDIDSIQIINTDTNEFDTLFVSYNADERYERANRYETQKLLLNRANLYKNGTYNGANKPFHWQESRVNSFDVSLDSVRTYLKLFILKKNAFSLYSEEKGYQRIIFTDTSRIVLKELYGDL